MLAGFFPAAHAASIAGKTTAAHKIAPENNTGCRVLNTKQKTYRILLLLLFE